MAPDRVRKRVRNVHTNKSDLGYALMIFSRSTNHGPGVFTEGLLQAHFFAVKTRRDGKSGKNSMRAFKEGVEEFITRKFIERHPDGTLSITVLARDRFRLLRRSIRESALPPTQIPPATTKLMKQFVGPQNHITKQHLNRLYNDLVVRENNQPQAVPLQEWSSVSTVDGSTFWGEQGEDHPAHRHIDGQDERMAGPSRSPVRPALNPAASYPTPETAPRPSGSRLRQRPIPHTPTPASRTGSQVLEEDGMGADELDYENLNVAQDENWSTLQINSKIDWSGDWECHGPANVRGSGMKCNHAHELAEKDDELDEIRRRLEKKSHDEKAVRSEKETIANERDMLAGENGRLVLERDAIAADRDYIAHDRDTIARAREAIADERDSLATENGVLTTELQGVTGQRDDLAAKTAALVAEQESLHDQLIALQREMNKLEDERGRWVEDRRQDKERVRLLDEQLEVAQQTIQALRTSIDELKQEKAHLLELRGNDGRAIAMVNHKLDDTNTALTTLKTKHDDLQARHTALQTLLTEVRHALTQRTADLETLTTQLQDTLFELGATQSDLSELSTSRAELETKYHVLLDELEEHEAAKQLVEIEKAALLETIGRCREQLRKYDRLAKMLDEQREACAPLLSTA